MQTSKISFKILTLIFAATLITACTKETRKARLLGEADDYFKAGNYDKAKVSYLNVVQLDPQNALAFERIGEIRARTQIGKRLLEIVERRNLHEAFRIGEAFEGNFLRLAHHAV